MVVVGFTAFFMIALYSQYLVATGQSTENACGFIGEFLASTHFTIFGFVSGFLAALAIGVWAGFRLFNFSIDNVWPRVAGMAIMFIAICSLEYRFTEVSLLPGFDYRGGVLGAFIGRWAFDAFGVTGTTIFAFLSLSLGLMFMTGIPVAHFLRTVLSVGAGFVGRIGGKTPDIARKVAGGLGSASEVTRTTLSKLSPSRGNSEVTAEERDLLLGDSDDEDEEEYEEEESAIYDEDDEYEEEEEEEEEEEYEEDPHAEYEEEEEEEEEYDEEEYEEDEDEEEEEEIPITRTIRLGPEQSEPMVSAYEEQLTFDGAYSPPPLNFLHGPKEVNHEEGREELNQVATQIEETLRSFKIESKVGNVQRGPVITQYELTLEPGVKVNKIVGLSDDLAMALSAKSVRVVAPIPGKPTVGIEVPNKQRESVVLKELLQSRAFAESDFGLPLLLGKDAAGVPIVADLTKMPHMLIAGSTGSGKSVCINTIITSLLMTRTPDELKLILVDPKMVELSAFEEIPHLLTPVITDMKKAPAALEWLVRKMEQRYELLSKVGVRDLKSYNDLEHEERYARLTEKVTHEEADEAPKQLPYMTIIIDELADLMMTSSKEVEASIIRLAQKSRAVGIHVILATQRPSVDVVTGLIKSNLPSRICFKVASKIDSRTVLDRIGGDKLLGMGDMLYLPPDTSTLERAQCTYVSDKEIRKIVKHLRNEAKPQFSKEIDNFLEGRQDGGGSGTPGTDDELFDEAVRIVIETGRGSTTLLQRRLSIGYTRASRLMDLMSEYGIVSSFKGSKAREVRISLEEWEEMSSQS